VVVHTQCAVAVRMWNPNVGSMGKSAPVGPQSVRWWWRGKSVQCAPQQESSPPRSVVVVQHPGEGIRPAPKSQSGPQHQLKCTTFITPRGNAPASRQVGTCNSSPRNSAVCNGRCHVTPGEMCTAAINVVAATVPPCSAQRTAHRHDVHTKVGSGGR